MHLYTQRADLGKTSPRVKSQRSVRLPGRNLFVFTKTGIRNRLVAELTEAQTTQPVIYYKHVVLVEKGLTLSTILDESRGGILSLGPIRQIRFDTDDELVTVAEQVAFNYLLAKQANAKPWENWKTPLLSPI